MTLLLSWYIRLTFTNSVSHKLFSVYLLAGGSVDNDPPQGHGCTQLTVSCPEGVSMLAVQGSYGLILNLYLMSPPPELPVEEQGLPEQPVHTFVQLHVSMGLPDRPVMTYFR